MPFTNLEEQFLAKIDDLYSLSKHPYKDSGELNPIIVYAPNDPNRPQGVGNTDRLVPVGAVLTDERRFAKLLTSPSGLKFFIKQELLQTGNALSETRILDPLFINKNLSPFVHSKRQLFDQTDVTVVDPNRSPASTPDVGVAGRLQRETGETAISHIMGRKTARQSVLDVLSSSQIGQTVTGLFHVTNGTYGINQRPEFSINGRWYSAILYTGRKPTINRELDILIDALQVAGAGASIVGLPNVFAGLKGGTPLPATSNFSTQGSDPLGTMPYFNPDIPGVNAETAGRYVKTHDIRKPGDILPSFLPAEVQSIVSVGLTTIVKNLLGFNFGSANRFANVLSFKPTLSIGPEIAVDSKDELLKLRKPERSMRQRYENPTDATTVLSSQSRDAISTIKTKLDSQGKPLKDRQSSVTLVPSTWGALYRKLGWKGGITPDNIDQLKNADSDAKQHSFQQNVRPYISDLLNLPANVEISGSTLPKDETFPQDYIDVHIVDKTNNRLIPFRAHLAGLSENVSTEYSTTRYIGRTERNIIYTGASRQLTFTLYLHAWSPSELDSVWKRVNILTGLAFPAKYSNDGYMIPPIVELTIGDFYKNQPGYIESVAHTIEDGTSWVIEPDHQVPQTIKVDITFAVIERFAMAARSAFYGFGLPRTNG